MLKKGAEGLEIREEEEWLDQRKREEERKRRVHNQLNETLFELQLQGRSQGLKHFASIDELI